MILLDTSGLLSALFPDQRLHRAYAEVLQRSRGPFLLSPYVLAELDYLIAKLAGVEVELRFLGDIARGAYRLEDFGAGEIAEARAVIEGHRDLNIGVADASLVVLARRRGADRLLALDERHFRNLPGLMGRPFHLLPADL